MRYMRVRFAIAAVGLTLIIASCDRNPTDTETASPIDSGTDLTAPPAQLVSQVEINCIAGSLASAGYAHQGIQVGKSALEVRTEGCPIDYRIWVDRHQAAWKRFMRIQSAKGTFWEGVGVQATGQFLDSLTGSEGKTQEIVAKHDDDLELQESDVIREIDMTYTQMREVALRHEVTPPDLARN